MVHCACDKFYLCSAVALVVCVAGSLDVSLVEYFANYSHIGTISSFFLFTVVFFKLLLLENLSATQLQFLV